MQAGRESTKGNAILRIPQRLVVGIGRTSRTVTEHSGQLGLLFWKIVVSLVQLKVSYREIMNQIYVMGIQSMPIVMVTAVLAGIVTSQQGGYQFTGTVPLYVMGSIVVTSVVLELAPVLTAIVLVGRVGARITAELGTMEVSEQIDAFHSVGRDPIAALAAPPLTSGDERTLRAWLTRVATNLAQLTHRRTSRRQQREAWAARQSKTASIAQRYARPTPSR